MAKLKDIWVEENIGQNKAIRIDWSNDRHQRVEIKGSGVDDVIDALDLIAHELAKDFHDRKI
jgi:hypothetical protein